MTVQSTTYKSGPYAGAGITGPFTVGFRFLDAAHLKVIKTSAAGIDTVLALTTDYTVSGVGNTTGSLTLTSALAVGEKLTIVRDVPFTQLADYVNNEAFPAESHEDALDKLTMMVQQLKERVDAALTLPATVYGANTQLPTPSSNKFIGWNEAATGLQNIDPVTLATIVAFGTARADTFTGDGVTTQFTLSANPGAQANLDVSMGGVTQYPVADYIWAGGATLTFTSPPPNGVKILARYFQGLPQGAADAAATTWLDNGGTLRDVQSTLRRLTADYLSVNDPRFGAKGDWNGSTGTDNTAAIQAAINWASNNGYSEVYLEAGTYLFSRLYFFYDAALNPGYNPAMQGRVRLVGCGQLNHSEANTWPSGGRTGTILLSSISTGDAIVISPASADGGAYPSRQTVMENLTVIANTTGFVVRHNCAISSQMRNVTVLQLNAAGSGVYWHSGWFTNWDSVWVTNLQTTGQTGVGMDFGATLFAGSFRFSNCCFERFRDGFQVNDSVQSVCLLFDGVGTFQSNARDGLQINAPIRSLVVDTGYFEFNGRSHVRCTLSSGGVQSLAIRGGFALGGTTGATSMTGPMFYLRNVTNWSIDGLAVFRPWTDIVDVAWYSANGSVGAIKNVCVDASDNTPGSTIYLVRVDDQRALPTLEGNNIFGSAQVKEFDNTTYMVNSKHRVLGFEAFAWCNPVQRKTLGLNGTDYLQSGTTAPLVIYNVTGAGSFLALPGSPGDGRKIIIANQTTSASSTIIRQSDAVTNLATLNAGQAYECHYEPTAAKWVAVGPLTFAGL